ncbi:MAG: glycosyltransferase [Planctomycetes bacterium]|jgi:glycosyltransferase involved in cell wall biosynthesis|nr:glycosyltransferase [Planctomycetota bacterium]
MKIRVLHVIDHLGYGGAPFVVKGLVERMPADRIESLVYALRPNPKPIPLAVPVITLTSHKYSPTAVWSLARLCRTRQIDIIHAHLQKAFLSSLLATYLGSSRLVLHEHGPIFRGGTGCLYRAFLRWFGPRANVIIANSEAAQVAVCRSLRRPEVPVEVVPNFIDAVQFDPDRYDRHAARESLGLGPEQFAVGFVGRLDRAKGADLLVEAAALLRYEPSSYRFIIVGDGPERSSLQARMRQLGLDRMVRLAGLQENPAAVMRAFDAGVVPSRREAFGIAALELMRMKVPVIVSRVGGLPELVRDGQTGIVLPQLLPQALAESIRRLREDRALRERLGQSAFVHASSFDGRAAVAQVVAIYERLRAQGQTRGT